MSKKHWYIYLISLLSVFALLLTGCGKKEKENPNFNSENYLSGLHYAVIEMADYGSIYLELDADVAPATVTNFVNLVNDGFYDGLTFHRIIAGFMMQGGDPDGDGTGGSEFTVPGEFVLNKHQNSISHVRGTISMARTSEYDSASSQFFIVQEDNTDLDGYYAAFGKVISGMDIVDAICIVTDVEDTNGTVLKENQPVIESIRMIDAADAIYDNEEDRPVEEVEERPEATAVLSFTMVSPSSVEDLTFTDTWEVSVDGKTFLLSSSTDLLSLGLYTTDISNGLDYGEDDLLAITNDLAANDAILIKLTVPDEVLPSLLLVAEEHNGAISRYLIYRNELDNGAYLVPIFE